MRTLKGRNPAIGTRSRNSETFVSLLSKVYIFIKFHGSHLKIADGRTDGRKDNVKTVYPPNTVHGGIKRPSIYWNLECIVEKTFHTKTCFKITQLQYEYKSACIK